MPHRITSAGAMFGSLSCTLCARHVSLTRKGRIYSSLVLSILLYGCESWALTADLRQKVTSFHNKCVRRMHRITLHHTQEHRIRAAALEEKLGIRGIQATMDDLRMRWAGHVARMPENRLPRRFLASWVRAKRRAGRPYMSTVQCTSDTIRRAGVSTQTWVEYASDREAWKITAAMVKPKLECQDLNRSIRLGQPAPRQQTGAVPQLQARLQQKHFSSRL